MKNNVLYYSVGPLLYCPANKLTVANSIINENFGTSFSLALCLEDTINDNFVEEAEQQLIQTISKIYNAYQAKPFYLPKIFIRVRNPKQICSLTKAFGTNIEIISGFIIPKFSLENSDEYIQELIKANELSGKRLFIMPIYESSSIIDLRTRYETMYELKDKLSAIKELVLNIRVGGNDLSHVFGFRRHCNESIHDIKPVSSIFTDIITVYGMDYVISGPVWEYYSGEGWSEGLTAELKADRLCGFTGKTVIHPNQIELVNEAYKVTKQDFNDAQAILNWNLNSNEFVLGSTEKIRMNEYKTHTNWAKQTIFLAEAYGIKA